MLQLLRWIHKMKSKFESWCDRWSYGGNGRRVTLWYFSRYYTIKGSYDVCYFGSQILNCKNPYVVLLPFTYRVAMRWVTSLLGRRVAVRLRIVLTFETFSVTVTHECSLLAFPSFTMVVAICRGTSIANPGVIGSTPISATWRHVESLSGRATYYCALQLFLHHN